jgi:hypothetical protein
MGKTRRGNRPFRVHGTKAELRRRRAEEADLIEERREHHHRPRPNGWACPRPDKLHHRTEDAARRHETEVRAVHGDDQPRVVYACRCGAGWVWGRA